MTTIEPPRLNRRDREVLIMLTWGWSDQQVADEFDVSLTVAKGYVHFACRKISVTRRSDAAKWGAQHGLAAGRSDRIQARTSSDLRQEGV